MGQAEEQRTNKIKILRIFFFIRIDEDFRFDLFAGSSSSSSGSIVAEVEVVVVDTIFVFNYTRRAPNYTYWDPKNFQLRIVLACTGGDMVDGRIKCSRKYIKKNREKTTTTTTK